MAIQSSLVIDHPPDDDLNLFEQVQILVKGEMSVSSACKKVGLARGSYYFHLKRAKEDADADAKARRDSARAALTKIEEMETTVKELKRTLRKELRRG